MTHDPYRRNMTGEVVDGRYLSEEMQVLPEWIDFNGHMNMAYYAILFDLGCNHAFRELGLSDDYRKSHGYTTMMADFRIRYLREVMEGDRLRCSFRIVKVGSKAFHYCQELIHSEGWIAATAEGVNLHVNMAAQKVEPYTDGPRKALETMATQQADWPMPDWVGTPLGVRN